MVTLPLLRMILEEHTREGERLREKEHIIPREVRIPSSRERAIILTGPRRAGKSTLAMLSRPDYARVSFDDPRLLDFTAQDYPLLLDAARLVKKPLKGLILDEVQLVPHWERMIARLLTEVPLIITGSTASMLEGSRAVRLTGRYYPIHVYPFSLREYACFTRERNMQHALLTYMPRGGFPQADEPGFIRQLAEDMLLRDVISAHGFKQKEAVVRLAQVVLSTPGMMITERRLAERIGVKHPETLSAYLAALEEAYLIIRIPAFSFKPAMRVTRRRKAYPIDPAFIFAFQLEPTAKQGHVLETIILLDLLRRGYQVSYYQDEKQREIDFIAEKPGSRLLIQVTAVDHPDMIPEREYAPLLETGLKGEKLVITRSAAGMREDIQIIPAAYWLKDAPEFAHYTC